MAGMHLSDLMGMEVRGMPLGVFFEGAAWADLSAAIERAIAGAMPFELELVSDGNALRPALRDWHLAGREAPRQLRSARSAWRSDGQTVNCFSL